VSCLEENTVLAFVEARLPPDSRAAVEANTRGCSRCYAFVAVVAADLPDLARTAVTERAGPTQPGQTAAKARIGLADAGRLFSAREPLSPGTSVARYTVLRLVGRGGMGEVYAAYDPELDRQVALKLIHAEAAARDGRARDRLLREAQVTAKLSHPNVVIVHDVGTFERQVFIAMEFLEGPTLAAWLGERTRPWREILATFIQAARGLAAAHAAGLVHRDFKPQNVMMTKDGTARVMDFGVARLIDGPETRDDEGRASDASVDPSLTGTGDLVGTPLFMAPEQFAAGRIDARTDQFSFCVALYWALCGVHPFGGIGQLRLPANLTREEVAAPASKTTAPGWIQKVLVRGLRVDPATRWPSMDALITELRREPARKSRRVALAVAGIVLCGALVASAAQLGHRSRSMCLGGPDRMTGIWETVDRAGPASRREMVRSAILASGTTEPTRAWERISSLMDRYAGKWLTSYRDACEATHVRGEQSDDVLDLRMTCLNDSLDSTRALTELLSKGDRRVIEHGTEAAGSLDDLQRCSDVDQLRLGIRPPKDPLIRARVEEMRKTLRDASALFEAGDREGGRRSAIVVLGAARSLHYCPLQAEAMVIEGGADMDLGTKEVTETLEGAIVLAQSCGHDRVVAEAATDLVAAYRFEDWEAVDRNSALASATLERVGGDARLEGWLANNVGVVHLMRGRLDEARRDLERAIRIKTSHLGADHVDVAISENNLASTLLGLGRLADALTLSDRVVATERRWVPPDSQILGQALGNRADILLALGRLDEAEEVIRHSWRVFEDPNKNDPERGALRGQFGRLLAARGRPRDAIPYLERALSSGAPDTPFQAADTQFELAKAREAASAGDRETLDLARRAESTLATLPGFAAEHLRVVAWLVAHEPKRHVDRDPRLTRPKPLDRRSRGRGGRA
jgi:tetratricopeptide (TPR) repeat protein